MRKLLFGVFVILCLVSLGLTVFLGYQYKKEQQRRETLAFEYAEEHSTTAVSEINRELGEMEVIVQNIADDLTRSELSEDDLAERLHSELKKRPDVFALGVGYAPEAEKDKHLYAPTYMRDDTGQLELIQVETIYDYTDRSLLEAAWYYDTLEKDTPQWIEPHFDEAEGTIVTQYAVPFYHLDPDTSAQVPAGVVYIEHSLESLTDFIKTLELGEEGYSYILSQEGQFVAHPDHLFLGKTIFEEAEELKNEQLRRDGERAISGEAFYQEEIDVETGEESWIFYEPISTTGWSIGLVIDKNIYAAPAEVRTRRLIEIGLVFVTFLFFLFALIFRFDKGAVFGLWGVSIATSLILFGGIIWIWFVVRANLPLHSPYETVLINQTQLNKILNEVDETLARRRQAPPIQIPTGIIVKNIKFTDINEVAVAGYIWQKYPLDLPQGIEQGFTLPDTLDPEGVTIEEVYRLQENGMETIGWSFRANLRQSLNFFQYPLDQETIHIEIWPLSLGHGMMLVPDLEDYEFPAPLKQPGLARNLHLEGWEVTHSYFSYGFDSYNANFGSKHTTHQREIIPDLFFGIGLERLILSPLIAHGVTTFVVAGLMFAVMLIYAENAFNVLTYAAALFFVSVVSHVGLRSELVTGGMVYMETFYLMLYVLLLFSGVSAMLLYSSIDIPFFKHDNLIPRFFYWPMYLGVLLVITLYVFYPRTVSPDPLETPSTMLPSEPVSEIQVTPDQGN